VAALLGGGLFALVFLGIVEQRGNVDPRDRAVTESVDHWRRLRQLARRGL
jgi:hypothetical protein